MLKKLQQTTRLIPLITILSIAGAMLWSFSPSFSFADEIDEIQQEIDLGKAKIKEFEQSVKDSKVLVESYKANQNSLYGQRYLIQADLDEVNAQVDENAANIEDLSTGIEKSQQLVNTRLAQKNSKIKTLYIGIKLPFIDKVFGSENLNYFSRIWKYKEAGVNADTDVLEVLSGQLRELDANLTESVTLREELLAVNVELEVQVSALNTQIAGWSSKISTEGQRQTDISGQINEIESLLGDLTAKQEELIRARIEAANKELSLNDGEPLSASIPDAPFTGGFAVASYGGPHRVGMNQYGALGRADSGQSAEQILGAYFANVEIDKNYGSDYTITVNGTNEYGQTFNNEQYNIEEYLKHLYEMPASWSMEALKAQAIAARTYALKYTNNGASSICPSQACQVVKFEKNAPAWQDAVDATAGWVIKNSGTLITPWYSSTSGGYTKTSEEVWGGYTAWTQVIKDYGPNGAYDGPAYGDSPWYHMVWGGVNDSWGGGGLPPCYYRGDCQPWLTNEQTQDLFNVMLLREIAGNVYDNHLSPVNWGDPNTWSEQQVIDKLVELGGTPTGHITNISIYENANNGDTTTVVVKSEVYPAREFGATDFKSIFYMRSPGTLIIRSTRFDFVGS